jgi:hypothetical protein
MQAKIYYFLWVIPGKKILLLPDEIVNHKIRPASLKE